MIRLDELKQTSPERFTLLFSDGSELKATLNLVTDRFLRAGMEVNGEEYAALKEACACSLCQAHALRLIGSQALSRKGLLDKLVQKGEDPENARRAVDYLAELGLLNDEDFAGIVVRHYAGKGYGPGRIRAELYRHGVPKELWDDALGGMPEQDEKIDKFVRARLTDPTDKNQIKKIADGLTRRGYSWREIKAALERFKAALEDTEWSEQSR
ncbi:MAG: regulatory protein RecX [Oscillospiraceae bacterium]|nr:regulatory protein RecX [Oscillospiraceae bacterium]